MSARGGRGRLLEEIIEMRKFCSIVVSILLISCSANQSDASKLKSKNFENKSERIEALKKEIKVFSEIRDAEFDLFNVNGFSNSRASLPGASAWDYKFAVKIDTADIKKWTEGMFELPTKDTTSAWLNEILGERKNNWIRTSIPKHFIRRGGVDVSIMVYEKEGILFKRVVN